MTKIDYHHGRWETFADQTCYVLVQRAGTDTLHINPREECNTNDADNLQTLHVATARSMALAAMTRAEVEVDFCQHYVTLAMVGTLTGLPDERTVETTGVRGRGLASDGVES